MADLTPVQVAAALIENVYRRSANDQPVELRDIDASASDVNLSGAPPQGLTTDNSGFWYNNTTGFVGRVVDVGGTVYVVFRGTDIGTNTSLTSGLVDFVLSGGTAAQTGGYDVLDWTRANLPLGLGIVSRTVLDTTDKKPQLQSGAAVTQLDDAVALMNAAVAAAGNRPVVVTGQSLGGGLAGLVSALFGKPAYLFDPAPFNNQLEVLAGQYAFNKHGLQPLLELMAGAGAVVQEALLTALGPLGPLGLLLSPAISRILEAVNVGSAAVSTLLQLDAPSLRAVMTFVARQVPEYSAEISRTIDAIIADRKSARDALQDNLFQGVQNGAVQRVDGEALTAGSLASYMRALGSTPFDVDVQRIDVGDPSDGSADRDRTIALHSPALINLLVRTKATSQDFATLLKQDAVLRSSLFKQDQISAPIGNGRADPELPSNVPGGGPATAILYDAACAGWSGTVSNQFIGLRPGITGSGNLNDTWGVAQITFADGVVWDVPDIAFAVAPNTDGVNGRLLGTAAMDVLDSARGNHYLSGGDGGDVYLYDRGNGATTIAVNKTNIFSTNPNYVSFGPGLTQDDVIFTRVGGSGDLLIKIRDGTRLPRRDDLHRRVIDYLLAPVLQYRHESGRER